MIKFIMMVGIPGSGKSHLAEKIAHEENGIIVSSDKIREELLENINEMRKNGIIFGEMLRRSVRALKKGCSVIYDATNIRSSERKSLLKKFDGYYKECYYIKVSLEEALRRNSNRDKQVPEEVIVKMFERLQPPQMTEGWDNIKVIAD